MVGFLLDLELDLALVSAPGISGSEDLHLLEDRVSPIDLPKDRLAPV